MARVRVILALAVACVLASVGALLQGAEYASETTQAAQEVVRAQRFELVDSQGRVRAVLGMIEPAAAVTSFRVIDRDGHEIVVPRDQAVVEGAPGISLFDETGQPRARIWLGPDGTPSLEMRQADGAVILTLPSEGRVKMLTK